jgi:hypothetical protein
MPARRRTGIRETLALPERDREDDEAKLVDQVVLDERAAS